jgi:SAM-dependent methyltransferase
MLLLTPLSNYHESDEMHSTNLCRVCGSSHLHSLPFGYRFEEAWLQALRCKQCGVIFLDPQPTDEQIRKMYSQEYFEGDFRCGHEGGYFEDKTLQSLSGDASVRAIQRYKQGGRFLEIGCAGGVFMDTMRKFGFEVHGVEVSEVAAQFARAHFGLDVFTGDLLEAHLPASSFDVVYMGDVIEHLPDPVGVIKEIVRILADGGVLVVVCPSQTNTIFSRLGFALYTLLGRRVTVSMPPYHLFEYRPSSLGMLLTRCGLTVVQTDAGVLPPGEIAQRGPSLQNAGKKILQYPNALITRLLGIWGDRLTVYARK